MFLRVSRVRSSSEASRTPSHEDPSSLKAMSQNDALNQLIQSYYHDTPYHRTRAYVYYIFEAQGGSMLSTAIAVVIFSLILLSSITLCIETLPELEDTPSSVWQTIEWISVIVFSVEYAIRFWASPCRLPFVSAPLNIIDLIAILPFYLELILHVDTGSTRIIRLIRLVRVFRVFRLARYSQGLRIIFRSFTQSKEALTMITFFGGIALVILSAIVYFIERGEWDAEREAWLVDRPPGDVDAALGDTSQIASDFQSIPDAFWWCVATFTTVGYGDLTPKTGLGRLVGGFTMMLGILIIALPASIVGSTFMGEWKEAGMDDSKKKKGVVDDTHPPTKKQLEDDMVQLRSSEHFIREVLEKYGPIMSARNRLLGIRPTLR